ncbi:MULTISPECIES: NAD-dependent epimerase/dehydratase family protein [Yersinia]|uniref:NAD-dependent epimerase/dehydratase family protein n=1 Tax=Yersinia sp. KBS0713 TaxID=1179669 RepID=UPI00155DB320
MSLLDVISKALREYFFSSAEVYGNLSKDIQYVLENDFGSLDCSELRACYAESKRMGETMCISWGE